MSDQLWHSLLPDKSGYTPWLADRGSLTLRIQKRCDLFRVASVRIQLMSATHDETRLLGVPLRQRVYTREVLLIADDKPVVFAHSVVATQHLRGPWHKLRTLGNRPLGGMLFSHPLVQRAPLHYRMLKKDHPLYRRAAAALENAPARLYARRSLFTLHGAPLLVTEIFLPEILRLRTAGPVERHASV
ncbi:MAG: chorismate lyase [Pseudomonadota bacterium]